MKKKILILGGLGFIGTNLIEELVNRNNYEIIIFESEKALIQNPRIFKQVEILYGDFNKVEDYEIIFKQNKIEIVFHLISTTIPSTSNQDIVFDVQSNLINTIKLLDLMVKYNTEHIVFFSSGGTIYGYPKNKNSMKESFSKNPISSYGIIKLTIERYIILYNYFYGVNYLIIRPSNSYGEYHSNPNQGIINVILSKMLKGEVVEIWGDGSVVRDYIYVKDLVKITMDLIDKKIINEIVNIGSGRGYKIKDIIDVIQKEIGNFQLRYKEGRKVDVPYIVLNIEKLKNFLDPKLLSLEEGIKRTYRWLVNLRI